MLTHTAGLPNFTNVTNFPDHPQFQRSPRTAEEIVGRFRDNPLEFAPGEEMNYSNSGYILLGFLIEKLSGASYAEFLQANIFTPLGMANSGYDSNSAIIAHRAAGRAPGPNGPVNAGYVHMSISACRRRPLLHDWRPAEVAASALRRQAVVCGLA